MDHQHIQPRRCHHPDGDRDVRARLALQALPAPFIGTLQTLGTQIPVSVAPARARSFKGPFAGGTDGSPWTSNSASALGRGVQLLRGVKIVVVTLLQCHVRGGDAR